MVEIIVCILYVISMLLMGLMAIIGVREEGNKSDKQDHEKTTDSYGKIHPEYRDALESVLKEKEEKVFLLNSIKLLNKEIESVKRIDEEIKGLLKE